MRLAAAGLSALALASPAAASAPCPSPPQAAYFAEVDRYGHRVLGPTPEWAGLRLGRATTTLPEDRIFEDVAPRVIDVGGDCVFEALVVESDATEGAQLAVYAPDGAGLRKIAATPPIGRAFRWLAPAGAADFDGDGVLDVALVRMPHILGALELWSFRPGGLTQVATLQGVTNHRIGAEEIMGGVRDCGAGPEIVVAAFDWRSLLAIRLEEGTLQARPIAADAAPASVAAAMACRR